MADSTAKKALRWVGEKMSGGMAGKAAKTLEETPAKREKQFEDKPPVAPESATQKPQKDFVFKRGGAVKARGDGVAQRGKTRGRMV